jgi:hypothetical protein
LDEKLKGGKEIEKKRKDEMENETRKTTDLTYSSSVTA